MTFLRTICFIIVMCTSFIAVFLCLFHSKLRARYGLSLRALTVMTMSSVIIGGIACVISHEVV